MVDYSGRTVLGSVALVSFIATTFAVLKGNFAYPLELFLLALLGILLVASLIAALNNSIPSLTYAIFFFASTINVAYLYSVSGYLSPARAMALGVPVIGLILSAISMLKHPVPAGLRSEVRKLIAAEKRLSEAKQKHDQIYAAEAAKPAAAVAKRGKARKKRGAGKKR